MRPRFTFALCFVGRRLQLLGGTVSTSKQTLISEPMPAYVTSYPDVISRLRDLGIFENSAHKAPNHIILNEYLAGQGIMPHEDGPSYHPVVATITLGSHTIFHYYAYKPPSEEGPDSNLNGNDSSLSGRTISPHPVLTVLLEPRSLIITRGKLYTGHLHGIDEVVEDRIHVDPEMNDIVMVSIASANQSEQVSAAESQGGTRIANGDLVADEHIKDVLKQGGVLKRETRYSLTCRDVEKVVNVNALFGSRKV